MYNRNDRDMRKNKRISMISYLSITSRLFKTAALAALVLFSYFAIFMAYLVIFHNTPLSLPAPTGIYPVGRVVFNWIDASRPDPLADEGRDTRKLVVWIWYPAANNGKTPAMYIPRSWAQVREKDQGVGLLIESNLSRIQTHSFEGVPIASTPRTFPVLVMQPGMGPMVTDYTVFAENLASHGYIVVGVHPTDTSNWTVFLDGQVAPRTDKGTIPDNDTEEKAGADASRILEVWTQDVEFVLTQLTNLNADPGSAFQNRMDLQRIGFWGHSFGGASALAICQTDSRCRAGIDMDGTPWGEETQTPVAKPFMFVTEDYQQSCDQNCQLMRQVYNNTQPGAAYFLSVSGAGHFNFSDLPYRHAPLVRPLFRLAGYEGSIQPVRALDITNAYLVAFFDHYLKGTQEDLLQQPSAAYPEVRFESH